MPENKQALNAILEIGIPAVDPPRAPLALGAGDDRDQEYAADAVIARDTCRTRDAAIDLIAEGFDMLEEDYEEERFFVAVRRGYWKAPEGSPTRTVGQALIDKLEF